MNGLFSSHSTKLAELPGPCTAQTFAGKLEGQRRPNPSPTPCRGHANRSLSCPRARKARSLEGLLYVAKHSLEELPSPAAFSWLRPIPVRPQKTSACPVAPRGQHTLAAPCQSPGRAPAGSSEAGEPHSSLLEPRGCSPGCWHGGLPPSSTAEHRRWHESVIAELIFR